jgi:2-methylcitrate dehydratase PrpD
VEPLPEPGPTQHLADFVAGLKYSDLPEGVRGKSADLLLDAVGCALAGWSAPEIQGVAAVGAHFGERTTSTIIGSDERSSLLGATLTNGYLTTGITACDVYTPAHFHATPEIIPVVLGVAEEIHATGEELLTATAAGLEVACRVAAALDNGNFRNRGWHSPGVIGPIGAAAAAAKLLKLDAVGVRRAIALAFSQSSGTFASWPTTAVKFHQARGAAAGLMGGLLAREGFEAGIEPLAAPDGGLFATYGAGDVRRLTDALGERWELANISLRLWPGATPIQALLTALLTNLDAPLPNLEAVEEVWIAVAPRTYAAHETVAVPTSTFEALLSFHFVAAVVLDTGTFWIDSAGPEGYGNPRLVDLAAKKIRLVADESVPMGGVEVRLVMPDGSEIKIRQDVALGTPSLPMTREQLADKFRKGAETRLSGSAATTLLRALEELALAPDVADLMTLTRPTGSEPVSEGSASTTSRGAMR